MGVPLGAACLMCDGFPFLKQLEDALFAVQIVVDYPKDHGDRAFSGGVMFTSTSNKKEHHPRNHDEEEDENDKRPVL